MEYYIDVIKTKKNNAAKKAPEDIAKICNYMGMAALKMPAIPYNKSVFFQKVWMISVWFFNLIKIKHKLKKNDILLIQHPLYATKLLLYFLRAVKKKGVKLIAIIHDLNLVRSNSETTFESQNKSVILQDTVILKFFDVIICHNKKMLECLRDNEFDPKKIVPLEIFDYLYEGELNLNRDDYQQLHSLVIAGNMSPVKSKYIYELANNMYKQDKYTLSLYGNDFCKELILQNTNVSYKGSISPDSLPMKLQYDYGIVWDGDTTHTCSGATGRYLRYNNPHKTSLYLASGLPVIVWQEAAIADFIIKNNLGVAVENLDNIDEILGKISEDEYKKMKSNVVDISYKLRKGHYFRKAYQEALRKCNMIS